MRTKHPKLVFKTGDQARTLRKQLGMSQSRFWSQISITQSGGSRYESGRDLPISVQYLLQIAFGTEKQHAELVLWLQRPNPEQPAATAPVRARATARPLRPALQANGIPG